MSNKNATEQPKSVVPPDAAEHWMSMEEACAAVARSRFTIAKMCREKILDKMRDGNRVLISRASVARWMKRYQPGQQVVAKSTRKRK